MDDRITVCYNKHEPLMRMMKKHFFTVFNHAKACASMHLLVEIHNNPQLTLQKKIRLFDPKSYVESLLSMQYKNCL